MKWDPTYKLKTNIRCEKEEAEVDASFEDIARRKNQWKCGLAVGCDGTC